MKVSYVESVTPDKPEVIMSDRSTSAVAEGIAIIGMSGRFPGARDVDQFWQNLVKGVDSVTRFHEDELEYSVAKADASEQDQKFIPARGVLDGVDLFDAEFFGMYPKEAQIVDPQHRLFLECAWEALESAGHAPESYPGMIGVYAGLAMNTYLLHNLCVDRPFAANFSANYQVGNYQTMLGNDKDFMPTRVSYKLNLRGPSMTIQTACSTSLVAVCQACTSLLTYQCDMALAGGVSITFPQKRDYRYQEEGLASADGTCRTFDADACGTVFGHGVAVVLLKRLEDALADRDSILAIIKGFALNNDGSDKIGYAAPSINAQADVVAMAQAAAGIAPETVSYLEAHGTATPLGDPIEMAALTAAFRRGGATRNQFCAVGTGKTNIGHLDVAAGAAGLIKTVLQLQHEMIPPLLHFKSANPKIDFEKSPFFPVSKMMEWKRNSTPRRAGVSALGIGGTNAHVVIEEAPLLSSGSSRKKHLLLLSAKTATALGSMSTRLAKHLEDTPDISLADVAFTLQRGRQRFRYRQAICAASPAEAIQKLRAADREATSMAQVPEESPSLVFLFPGQGSQYVNMGRELYETEDVFRAAVDRCAECLKNHLGLDIRSVVYSEGPEATAKAQQQINETRVTQPVIFTLEYGLACLWISWGIKPSLLIGHSVGEYVAAVVAQVFSLEDALGILASRAKLMQDLPGGSMLAVRRSVSDLEGTLPDEVAIAAINSPVLTTLSGPTPTLRQLEEKFEARGIFCRLLPTSHAFHSSMMDPIVEPFSKLAGAVRHSKATLPWISTFTGTWMDPEHGPDGSYWGGQLRRTVRFGQAVETALKSGAATFLEVGPGQALTQLTRQQPSIPAGLVTLTTLGPNDTSPLDLATMLNSLGRLWMNGIEPDWVKFYSNEDRKRLALPTYPFERKSYWISPPGEVKDSQEKGAPVTSARDAGKGRSTAEFPGAHIEGTTHITLPHSHVPEDAGSAACRLIERQMQLMTEQLEMLRK
jgi:acyl transferase domain-containing protein